MLTKLLKKQLAIPENNSSEATFQITSQNPKKPKQGYQEVFTNGFVKDYPLAIRHNSGKVTDVIYNASLFTETQQGQIQGVFAAARDITQRKAMENELRASTRETQSNPTLSWSSLPM